MTAVVAGRRRSLSSLVVLGVMAAATACAPSNAQPTSDGLDATDAHPSTSAAATTSAVPERVTVEAALPTTPRPVATVSVASPTLPPTVGAPRATLDTTPPLDGTTTPYRVPVADVEAAAWGETHAGYPATDIFVGCGAPIVAPVDGVVAESRRLNAYDAQVDNPATRGGRSVSIIGDDGVRYYMAHFELIEEGIEPGARVRVGDTLGEMGQTGRRPHVTFTSESPHHARSRSGLSGAA